VFLETHKACSEMLACESYKPNLFDIDQTLEPFDCSLHRTEPAPPLLMMFERHNRT